MNAICFSSLVRAHLLFESIVQLPVSMFPPDIAEGVERLCIRSHFIAQLFSDRFDVLLHSPIHVPSGVIISAISDSPTVFHNFNLVPQYIIDSFGLTPEGPILIDVTDPRLSTGPVEVEKLYTADDVYPYHIRTDHHHGVRLS